MSAGAVPSTVWPRHKWRVVDTRGAKELQKAARKRGLPIHRLAAETGLPPRALTRWINGEGGPRDVAKLNSALGLKLNRKDFEVSA